MTQPVATGSRTTIAIEQNSRVIDMSDTIHLLDPNEAPLTAITMKLNKVTAINPKFEWLEDDYLPTTYVLTATTATGAAGTSGTFTSTGNAARVRIGDTLVALDSGEMIYVTAVNANGNDFTGTRGIGAAGTTLTTLAIGAVLLIMGNSNAENSLMREQKTTTKTALFNFTQIWRWEWGVSGTLQASELYGGNDLDYQTKKAGKEFRIQLERSCLFGQRASGLAGGGPTTDASTRRFTGGILERITTNSTTTAVLTMDVVETFMRNLFRYGPAKKMLFASRQVMSFLSLIASAGDRIKTVPTDDTFPLALVRWVSPHGEIYLATHNLLEGDGGTTHNYQGWALGLDMDSIFYRPLRGRDTKIKTNLQANDQDGRIDGYIAEAGFMVVQEQNHSVLKGVASYA